MNTLDVLKAARALISEPAKWTQGAIAYDDDAYPVSADDADATCFCTVGAIERIAGTGVLFDKTRRQLERTLGRKVLAEYAGCKLIPIAAWNDAPGRTHGDVLGLFDTAIARLESEARA